MKNIKVGLSISLTGSYCVQGIESFQGIELWVSEINSDGGIYVKEFGKKLPIRLLYYDDESSVDKCRDNYEMLLQGDNVDILLGPYSSSLALVACEVAEQYNTTIWNYGGSTDEIEEREFQNVINAITPASRYSHGIIEALSKTDTNLKRIAAFSAHNSGFSKRISYEAKRYAESKGLEVKEFKFLSGTGDFAHFFDELKGFAPDLILAMGRAHDDLRLAEQLFQHNIKSSAMAFIVASIKLFKEKFGDDVEGILSSSQWEKGLRIEPDIGLSPEEFSCRFSAVYNKEPDYLAAQGYNIGLILEKCIQETGTLDDISLRNFAKNADFNTFYGKFKTDENGNQIGHQMVVVQWQKGKKVIVWPENLAEYAILCPR